MLAYILAVLVGTGSVGLYTAAFFLPAVHRKYDFIWSGVGFFYALVLWIYARQFTGGILAGQTASIALLGWFAWQTFQLRRQLVPTDLQTPLSSVGKVPQQSDLKSPLPTAGASIRPSAVTKSKSASVAIPAPPTPTTPARSSPVPPVSIPAPPTSTTPARSSPVPPVSIPAPPTPTTPARSSPAPPVSIPLQPQLSPAKETVIPPVAIQPEPEEAWITLELKPSPTATSQPLGQAVRPPSNPVDTPANRQITTDPIKNIPTVDVDRVDQ
jgi:Ycf66 protein N-terminus